MEWWNLIIGMLFEPQIQTHTHWNVFVVCVTETNWNWKQAFITLGKDIIALLTHSQMLSHWYVSVSVMVCLCCLISSFFFLILFPSSPSSLSFNRNGKQKLHLHSNTHTSHWINLLFVSEHAIMSSWWLIEDANAR